MVASAIGTGDGPEGECDQRRSMEEARDSLEGSYIMLSSVAPIHPNVSSIGVIGDTL